jgi:hypothetical protein
MPRIRHCPPSEHHEDRNLKNKGLKREQYNQKTNRRNREAKKGLIIEGKLFVGLPMPSSFSSVSWRCAPGIHATSFWVVLAPWVRIFVMLCMMAAMQTRWHAFMPRELSHVCFPFLDFWFLLLSFKHFLGIRGGSIDTWTLDTKNNRTWG